MAGVLQTHPGRNGGGGPGTYGHPGIAYTFVGFGKPKEVDFIALAAEEEEEEGGGDGAGESSERRKREEREIPCVVEEGGRVVLCGPLWRRRL